MQNHHSIKDKKADSGHAYVVMYYNDEVKAIKLYDPKKCLSNQNFPPHLLHGSSPRLENYGFLSISLKIGRNEIFAF